MCDRYRIVLKNVTTIIIKDGWKDMDNSLCIFIYNDESEMINEVIEFQFVSLLFDLQAKFHN